MVCVRYHFGIYRRVTSAQLQNQYKQYNVQRLYARCILTYLSIAAYSQLSNLSGFTLIHVDYIL